MSVGDFGTTRIGHATLDWLHRLSLGLVPQPLQIATHVTAVGYQTETADEIAKLSEPYQKCSPGGSTQLSEDKKVD
jgi:hypothetical protein